MESQGTLAAGLDITFPHEVHETINRDDPPSRRQQDGQELSLTTGRDRNQLRTIQDSKVAEDLESNRHLVILAKHRPACERFADILRTARNRSGRVALRATLSGRGRDDRSKIETNGRRPRTRERHDYGF
jgi:hypothetical protein